MRLGELLIREGTITREQLQETLQAQLIYGGHLGTCLIEARLITEERLGRMLSRVHGVSHATKEMFAGIPRGVVRKVPRQLVDRHRVVPLRIRDREMDLAMIDPADLEAVDEVSFVAGSKVVPWVAPEVRVVQAMERYYEIPRRVRYVTLGRYLDQAEGDELVVYHAGGNVHSVPSTSAEAQIPEVDADDPPRQPSPVSESPGTDEELASRLCATTSLVEAADALMDHLTRWGKRVALFWVKAGSAAVWQHRGFDLAPRARDAVFSVVAEPVFRLLMGDGYYFRGPVNGSSECRRFFDALGLSRPEHCVLMPVHVNDRLLAVVYADPGERGEVAGTRAEHRRAVKQFALAMSMVALKQKILAA